MKRIPLTRGYFTTVDDVDYQRASKFRWCVHTRKDSDRKYAIRRGRAGEKRTVGLHRWLLNAQDGTEVDHKNGDGLDNRRSNIRICTTSQNSKGKHRSSNKYGIKGVRKQGNSWLARIIVDYRQIHLGSFRTALAAQRAYNRAAKQYFGEFAVASRRHYNTK